jgi:hypothetical protein
MEEERKKEKPQKETGEERPVVPVSHHPYPSIPLQSTAHEHALSPSQPPSPGSTRNAIALSAHAVEHPL